MGEFVLNSPNAAFRAVLSCPTAPLGNNGVGEWNGYFGIPAVGSEHAAGCSEKSGTSARESPMVFMGFPLGHRLWHWKGATGCAPAGGRSSSSQSEFSLPWNPQSVVFFWFRCCWLQRDLGQRPKKDTLVRLGVPRLLRGQHERTMARAHCRIAPFVRFRSNRPPHSSRARPILRRRPPRRPFLPPPRHSTHPLRHSLR